MDNDWLGRRRQWVVTASIGRKRVDQHARLIGDHLSNDSLGRNVRVLLRPEEGVKLEYLFTEFWKGYARERVQEEDPLEQVMRVIRDRKLSSEKVFIVQKLGKAGVGGHCESPWVATCDHVGQDDTESPNISVAGRIASILDFLADTFYGRKVRC